MKKYFILSILILLLVLVLSIFYFNSNSQQDVIIDDTESIEHVSSGVHLTMNNDSIRCVLRITNNSKKIVYYPALRFVVNDLFPVPVYYHSIFDNGHIINIIPSKSDAAAATLNIMLTNNNYIPNYYF